MPPAAPLSPMASAKHKSSSSYAAAATSSATSTSTAPAPILSYHAHPLNPRSSITISREGSPTSRTSMSTLHRPTFVHATTSYAVATAAGSSAAGSSSASGHGSKGESRGGSAKPYSEDEGYRKEVSAYYPPEFPHPDGPYPYPHHQYTPFTQSDRPDAETSVLDRLRTAGRKMFGRNDSRESKLACLQCSNSEEGGELGRAMMFGWVITTVAFFLAIAFWRGELFRALDKLSHYLAEQGIYGHLTFYVLIFITTIPPLPLYSTLIILSGYTFGVWQGFLVSYLASLSGAIVVFLVSRKMLRDTIVKCLASSSISMSLLHILPTHPHLLLLIRIAPYPYNLLNVILASSPTLTLQTYTGCTAVSLCKLVLHTWIGSGIHDLSESYGHGQSKGQEESKEGDGVDGQWPQDPDGVTGRPAQEGDTQTAKTWTTWVGIVLCIVLFFYLMHFAKRAVKKAQAEQAEMEEREREEREGLTSVYARRESEGEEMV
ncbi:cytoplasmic protein [Cryptococcus neoformans Bt1]|nr:cytoplasmic protein [Cryptococcus neoformans var. grubii Bt1]